MSLRRAATDSAFARAAWPVQLGRIALSIGCKARECSGAMFRRNEFTVRFWIFAKSAMLGGRWWGVFECRESQRSRSGLIKLPGFGVAWAQGIRPCGGAPPREQTT